MHAHDTRQLRRTHGWAMAVPVMIPLEALAQAAGSPFMTGATALQTNILAWLTPIAVILVMALGAMAMANRMSWGWCLGAIFGIAIAFGAPQIARRKLRQHVDSALFRQRARWHLAIRLAPDRRARSHAHQYLALAPRHRLWPAVTKAEHCRTEAAVMASQIEQLPDLSGYLKFASEPRVAARAPAARVQRAPENNEPAASVVRIRRGHTALRTEAVRRRAARPRAGALSERHERA